jgi:hypothetical protein
MFCLMLLACAPLAAGDLPAGDDPAALDSLRAAVAELSAEYGDGYQRGKDYLAAIERLEKQTPAERAEALAALRREALLAHPLLTKQPLLFVVRRQYKRDHHNTETMFQTGEINTGSFEGGGALKSLDLATGEVRTIIDVPEGVARDPDVSFDGRKILFSMRRDRDDDYHLYEIDADGSHLRQITFGRGISDIDPIYLPDGRILFTSTREPKYCMCNRHIMGNLFTVDADGGNIEQIGRSTLHEGHAALLPDGRVIYDRWEYVDRNFGDAQGVWVCNPDGTNHAVYWGNNTNSPGAVLDARPLPGSHRFVATFSSCHDRPWGALAIVDREVGLDGRAPVVRTWPANAIDLVGRGNYDTFCGVKTKFEDPWPLGDRHFLCARMTGESEEMGLYLVDAHGHELLVHREAPGCYDPMPLGPRDRPPVIPSRVDRSRPTGNFYVQDVYRGTGMERIARGTIKSLRVVESPEKRFFTPHGWDGGTGQQAPGMAWDDFNNKRILGTAAVEPDGSVYFEVPADTFVYFQLLDERGMMVQSMRSGTIVRPGETAGCVGCHEDRRTSSLPTVSPASVARRPRALTPWHGPARLFSYTAEVQPVFDKHCAACHNVDEAAGEKLNLAGDLGLVFNASYVDLRSRRLVNVVGAGPHQVQMPKSWGSHASRLANVLLEGHGKPEIDALVKLDAESFDRIVTWIDLNAPYYPEYAAGAYRQQPFGRSPIDGKQLARLSELTGVKLSDRKHVGAVNFSRAELSPCLAAMDRDSKAYEEALAIIEAGRAMLQRHPRADMPGFELSDPIEIEQQRKYDTLRSAGRQARAHHAPP